MIRAIILSALMITATPALAADVAEGTIMSQQNQAPQQSPKRDCERKQDEGVSA